MKKALLILMLILISPATVLQAQRVKVISFNIRYDGAKQEDGENAWYYRSKAVINMIKKEQSLIIVMFLYQNLHFKNKYILN
mgnify:CR=1 FL=1